MARKEKPATWSKVINEAGVEVRIFERERGSLLYRSVVVNGRKERKSLGHRDRKLAEQQAKALARALAEAKLVGRTGKVTVGQLFDLYRRHKMPTLSEDWRQAAETRIALFLKAWGRELDVADVDQTRVDAYVMKRRSLEVVPKSMEAPEGEEKPRRGYRKPRAVRDGTLDADFRWLSSVFNWGRRHKIDGKKLLPENPLHDVEWPKEKNVRRPVASHQRYVATMKHVDAVDPEGRLRCILTLARYTGRRESAICALRASDVLLSEEKIRAALAAAGMDEGIAGHMPFGALRWSAETDKQGILHITPISEPCRNELDRYLRQSPRLGDAPLFPAPGDPTTSIRRDVAANWLLKAERLAEAPKLDGGVFHPYRRLWASERKNLPDVDVAAAGGWKDTRALKQSYQQTDPATILRVVQHHGA